MADAAPDAFIVCETSGIRIPTDLADNLVAVSEMVPNTWNPNRMDSFMRAKLIRSFRKDGFYVPVIVRPIEASVRADKADLITKGVRFEIVDGEHRWELASSEGMAEVPVVNVGSISDAQAKEITVKANALKGEFDSVQLAELVKGLADENGLQNLVDDMPYTQERLQAMVDLLNVDHGTINFPSPSAPSDKDDDDGDDDGDDGDAPAPAAGEEFKSFDGAAMKFDHKCPRCNFEFNTPKVA